MKIKIHLVNGDIIEINNVDDKSLLEGIEHSRGDYATLLFNSCYVFVKNIMYIEIEE